MQRVKTVLLFPSVGRDLTDPKPHGLLEVEVVGAGGLRGLPRSLRLGGFVPQPTDPIVATVPPAVTDAARRFVAVGLLPNGREIGAGQGQAQRWFAAEEVPNPAKQAHLNVRRIR